MSQRKKTSVTTTQQEQHSFLGHSFEGENDSDADFVISWDEFDVNTDCIEVDTPAMD